jgi:hypothetical protein
VQGIIAGGVVVIALLLATVVARDIMHDRRAARETARAAREEACSAWLDKASGGYTVAVARDLYDRCVAGDGEPPSW